MSFFSDAVHIYPYNSELHSKNKRRIFPLTILFLSFSPPISYRGRKFSCSMKQFIILHADFTCILRLGFFFSVCINSVYSTISCHFISYYLSRIIPIVVFYPFIKFFISTYNSSHWREWRHWSLFWNKGLFGLPSAMSWKVCISFWEHCFLICVLKSFSDLLP